MLHRMAASVAALTVIAAACGDAGTSNIEPDSSGVLADVCPSTVVFQTDWFPQAEHGGLYQLVGDDYTVNKTEGTTTGSMTSAGVDLGVKIEIRAGGPFIQSPVVTEMYQGDAVLMGYVGTDVAVSRYADAPTIAVFNALNVNPQIVLWDKTKHPDATTLKEVAQAVKAVYVFGEPSWVKYLIDQAVLDSSQIDSNYQGNLILATEDVAHQGFLTSEPFKYTKLSTGPIDVDSVLIHDLGWTSYAQNLAVRKDRLTELRPCLELLVPILQQAQIDFINDPERASAIIVDAVATFDSYWTQTDEDTAYSVATQIEAGIIGNGVTPTFGDLEDERVRDFIAKVTPILRSTGREVPDLEPSDIVDNSFLDPNISYGSN